MKDLKEVYSFLSQIPRMMGMLNMPSEKLEIFQEIRQIICEWKEYKDLEEQGLLLKLPCKVGDKAYSFSGEKVLTLIVDSFVICADGIDARLVDGEEKYKFLKVDLDISDFGKTWFATQKEAGEALRRMDRTEETRDDRI